MEQGPSEAEIVEYWFKKKSITVSDLFQIDERYHRYLHRISYWKDSQGNDYSYLQKKIYEFVNIDNNSFMLDHKFKMMKYIDGEIMLMNNICLMNDAYI
jgi:hypothetical protein